MTSPTIGSAARHPSAAPCGAEEDGERGEAVGAGVQSVGDEGGGADPAAGADAVAGHPFVADEADHRGGGDRPQVGDVAGPEEPVDRLVRSQGGGCGDGEHDGDAGQVLGASVTVGVAAVRRTAAQDERDAQRDGGQCVGGVVEGVAQQRDRPRQHDDDRLDHRGRPQDAQGQPQGAHPLPGGLHRRVDLVHGLVTVRRDHMGDLVPHPRPARAVALAALRVPVVVRVLVTVVMPVPGTRFGVTMVVLLAHGALAFVRRRCGRRSHPPIMCV